MSDPQGNDRATDFPDLAPLITAVSIALGLGFVFLAFAVQLGGTQTADEWGLRSLRALALRDPQIGRVWAEESVIAITSLGSVLVTSSLTVAVSGMMLLLGKRQPAFLLLGALLGTLLLNYTLKMSFARPRPEVVARLQYVDSMSFPSGHALISTAVYTTLGAVASGLVRERKLKIYVMTIAVTVPFLVGISRVYLGVHYPSDVLGGWIVGFLWAGVWWRAARAQEQRALKRTR
jgi:undecaprenyl-diphosphatase